MSSAVSKLATTALHHNAVTVSADPLFDMAHRLVQEFVRIRPPPSVLAAMEKKFNDASSKFKRGGNKRGQ